ncbi:hypothetical protein NSQ82_01430 [Caldifermentibacillus hisashii]|uniref:hypothetical protein n=1 Tax=Caldifermentibacillus hisashii TaxID=996558 RepID=UPI0031B692A1
MKFKCGKYVSFFVLIVLLLASATSVSANTSNEMESLKKKVPTQMKPGTILKYDKNTNPIITYDTAEVIISPDVLREKAVKTTQPEVSYEHADIEGEALEDGKLSLDDAFVEKLRKEAEESGLPVIDLGFDLPDPEPGLVIIYGTDGQINRYYNEFEVKKEQPINSVFSTIPNKTLPYPGRLAPGVYAYGTNQKITITPGHVLGEGRFTVFRAGTGGSGSIGSSGKVLGVGDVATKRQVDNPLHNTIVYGKIKVQSFAKEKCRVLH